MVGDVTGAGEGRRQAALGWPGLGQITLFYGLCLIGGGYAQLLAIIPGTGISIWLLSGLLLGVLLVFPGRTWPWWVAAAAVAELTGNVLWFGNSLPVALLITLGNVAESVVGAFLMTRLIGRPYRFETVRDVLGFVLLGAIVAPVVAATIGALTLGWSEGQPFQRAFWLFWIGDATGVLIVAPAVVVVVDAVHRGTPPALKWPEAAALTVGSILLAAASLTGQLPFGLLILPLVLLAAVRFQFWGSIVSSAALVLLSAGFQLSGVNPFALVGRELEAHVQLQLFLAIAAFSTLVVAALARQNEETLRRLRDANRDLELRVEERTSRLTASEARLKKVLDTAQVGVAFANEKGVLTQANETLSRLLGRTPRELGGGTVTWRSMLADTDQTPFNHELSRLIAEGKAGPIDLVFSRPDGTKVPTIFAVSRLDRGEHVAFIVDQSEQKQHEEQIGLLMRELNHRAKNTLMLVLAIARQTRAATVGEFFERFSERVHALSASQDLLVENMWKGAPLERVVRDQLSHLRDALDTRITIAGPPVTLSASSAQTIGLAIHELATNSGKYGALSTDAGRIAIAWERRGETLRFSWTESGGPPVTMPDHEGFGTTVVGAMVRSSLGCEVAIDYEPSGLRWSIECPLETLATA